MQENLKFPCNMLSWSLKYLAGHRNQSDENHYPCNDAGIVAADRSILEQAKLGC
jgi:hypothetical protein